MRCMYNIKQRGSDVFKMPGIPRTHIERSITRGRNPFINLNKCDPWKGSAVNGALDWLQPLRIHFKVKHSLAVHQTLALIPQSQLGGMKPIIKTQDYASADEGTFVMFKENQIKPFWCVLRLVPTWTETRNKLMIYGKPLTERKVTVLWEGLFFVRSSELECFDLRAQERISCPELQWANCWWNPQCVSDGKNAARAASAQLKGIPGFTVPLHHVCLVQGQPVNCRALWALEFFSRSNLEKEKNKRDVLVFMWKSQWVFFFKCKYIYLYIFFYKKFSNCQFYCEVVFKFAIAASQALSRQIHIRN